MLREGAEVAGHRLIEKLGQGRFGQVWKAAHDGGACALKLFSRPARMAQLRRGALAQYALGRLPAPAGRFFPRVDRIDLEHDPPYMRMELVAGVSLEEVIGAGELPLERRLALGRQILEALAVIHAQGFVHGDLSPHNVIVSADGEPSVRLIDVGFGALADEEGEDPAHSDEAPGADRPYGVASPLYAAPERFRSEFLDGQAEASDLFSYGKILYRLLTGESPHVVKPVSRKIPQLGHGWDDFVFQCVEERPEDRFVNAGAALAAFRSLEGAAKMTCPECDEITALAGVKAGDRVVCPDCLATVEILSVGARAGTADAALVSEAQPLEGECPSCGEALEAGTRRCPSCGLLSTGFVRQVIHEAAATVPPKPLPPAPSFLLPAFFTLVGYGACWLPGAILNLHFLSESNQVEQKYGRQPEGATLLHVMIWLLVYMPLIFLGSVAVFGILGALL
jgi:hypothetical protein